MNFWDKNVYININTNELIAEVDRETNNITTEVDGLLEDVAVVNASCVVRKLSQRMAFLPGSVNCHCVSHQYDKSVVINYLAKVCSTK